MKTIETADTDPTRAAKELCGPGEKVKTCRGTDSFGRPSAVIYNSAGREVARVISSAHTSGKR